MGDTHDKFGDAFQERGREKAAAQMTTVWLAKTKSNPDVSVHVFSVPSIDARPVALLPLRAGEYPQGECSLVGASLSTPPC